MRYGEGVAVLEIAPVRSPLRVDADGVVRVGMTRVTLDTVIGAFAAGCTPEEIVVKYPSLELADAYAVIAHYLRDRPAIDRYLASRATAAESVRGEVEARSPLGDVRARLLARRPLAS